MEIVEELMEIWPNEVCDTTTSIDPHIVEHHRHFASCMSYWLLPIYVLTVFQLQLLIALSSFTNIAYIFTLTCLFAA